MKKLKVFLTFVLCMIMCFCVCANVNAAGLNINTISYNQILGINTFRMNLPYNITYGGIVQSKSHAYTEVNSAFKGAAENPYHLFRFDSPDAYISAIYNNVGWYNDGISEKSVNAVMTVYNYSTNRGKVGGAPVYDDCKIGFNYVGLTWILLNDRIRDDNLHSDVQIYFYYSDDPSMQPIDMGQAYIGVGGQNSEKRVWNGTVEYNSEMANAQRNQFNMTGAGINGHQWEWASYDSYLKNSILQVYKTDSCVLKYVARNETVQATDCDTNNGPYAVKDYGWGTSSPLSTFDVPMTNPTGYNVLSNAGTRYDSNIYRDINGFAGSFANANYARDKIVYMVQVGRVENYSTDLENIKGTSGRTDGKPFSVYNFTSGKDVGSVELGIEPDALATEVKKPGKAVDKTVAHEQENVKYTITQQVGNMNDRNKRIDQRTAYTSLVVTDPLPKEVEFVSAVVKNENNTVIAQYSNGSQTLGNSNCIINYNANNHTLTYSFTRNYLTNVMRYVGEIYSFEINTKIRDLQNSDDNDYVATNKAITAFSTEGTSNYTVETEQVNTQIIYDILTKSVNATISSMITEINGGTSGHKVEFTPDIGYYIDTVEWQTQTDRYASRTDLLPNITEIPENNKVLIPENKNGSEASYKFEKTITGQNPNLPSGNNQTNITDEEKEKLNYDPFAKTTFTFNNIDNNHYVKVVAKPMKMVIQVSKEDAVTGKKTQGDAKFVNAEYTVYTDYNAETGELSNPVDVIVLDAEGNGQSKKLPLEKKDADNIPYGEYYVKETKAPEGYLLDEEVYRISKTAVQQTIDREKVSYHQITSKEEVKKGRIEVIKGEQIKGTSEAKPATGAVLKLHLDSAETEIVDENTYYLTIDENGYGEFKSELLKDYAPYTIPYGQYTITEVKESDEGDHTHYYIKPEKVDLRKKHEQNEYRIFNEKLSEAYLKIQKIDKDTNEEVHIAGAKYKIWDCQEDNWVVQNKYPSGDIEVFETDEDGFFCTPEPLTAGNYVIYEIEAPEGYYLNDELREPQDKKDLGNAEKGGVAFRIDTVAMGLMTEEELIFNENAKYFYEQEIKNDPLKAKLEITKTGEVLTDASSRTTDYGEKYTPRYTLENIPGVTYEIYANEDIKSPDGRITYVTKGSLVDTVTTGANGVATTKDLYVGSYQVKETKVPKGYVLDEEIKEVTLTNTNSLNRVEVHTLTLNNPRQRLEITFNKLYENVDYATTEDLEYVSVFGVYTKEPIRSVNGKQIISADELVDIITANGNSAKVTSVIDLPEGSYYVKELQTSYPFKESDKVVEFTLEYNGNPTQATIVKQLEDFENIYDKTSLMLVKLPTTIVDEVVLHGQIIDDSKLELKSKEIIEAIKGMSEEEIAQYLDENGIKHVSDAKYRIFVDEECTTPLRLKNKETGKYDIADLVTNENGIIRLENIPFGQYFIKEIEAPKYYQLSDEVTRINITDVSKDKLIYSALVDDVLYGEYIQKIDKFTGKKVPNCTFVITDEDGNVVVDKTVTDEDGKAYFPLNLELEEGKQYFFKEIDAPQVYKEDGQMLEANTKPIPFTAKKDENGEWSIEVEKIENYRPLSNIKITKLDIEDEKPIAGVKFELRSTETEFVVEAVTDENGECVFENIPYGEYTYRELEAPEEYLIDENTYELKVDAKEMELRVKDERNPDTGDIQVIAFVCIALVSIAGISVVALKKAKNN